MVHNKRKKFSRQRATHTHGWGAKKKHRGAGHRGGRGNAGLGKKGDARKTLIWKDMKHFGKYGFVARKYKTGKTINISQLEAMMPKLTQKGLALENKGILLIQLEKLGYGKLLATGNPTKKLHITVNEASKTAIAKIEETGGKVELLRKKQEKKEKGKTAGQPESP